MAFGTDVGNSIEVRTFGELDGAWATLSSNGDRTPITDAIISAMAVLAMVAGMA